MGSGELPPGRPIASLVTWVTAGEIVAWQESLRGMVEVVLGEISRYPAGEVLLGRQDEPLLHLLSSMARGCPARMIGFGGQIAESGRPGNLHVPLLAAAQVQ